MHIENKIIKKILEKYKTIWALKHLSTLADWDMNTYMPEQGFEARSIALSKTAVLMQKLFLDKSFIKLIEKAKQETLNDYEKGILRLLLRQQKFYQKLPKKFIEEFVKTTSIAHLDWKKAKEKNDFNLFKDSLQKIIDLSRKKAEYLGYENHPYDALLDEYEEDLTTKDAENFFRSIKPEIIDLLKKVQTSKNFKLSHPIEEISYDLDKMKDFNNKLLKKIHYNPNHLRLDISPHPFSTAIGQGDSRITTRYDSKDFKKSYSSIMHEYGHALYDLQSHENLAYTPISGGNSLIIHESQSRFWENLIGKNPEFLKFILSEINEIGPDNYELNDLNEYLNLVKPSLIRTEADEISYHLHILIRFEIEKDLIEGKININDLPKIWNQKYSDYLRITPKNDTEGILQDIHWSMGSIGYFPTYSFGTALSLIWKKNLEKDLGKFEDNINSIDGIRRIQKWLKDNIHEHGSAYTFKQLVKKIDNQDFSEQEFLKYLKEKYEKIY